MKKTYFAKVGSISFCLQDEEPCVVSRYTGFVPSSFDYNRNQMAAKHTTDIFLRFDMVHKLSFQLCPKVYNI